MKNLKYCYPNQSIVFYLESIHFGNARMQENWREYALFNNNFIDLLPRFSTYEQDQSGHDVLTQPEGRQVQGGQPSKRKPQTRRWRDKNPE